MSFHYAETKTINLKGDPDYYRFRGFKKLIDRNPSLLLHKRISFADYTIFFNLDHSKGLSDQIDEVSNPNTHSFNVVDLSKDYLDDPDLGPYYILLIACADCLITTDDYLQERIFNITGRLAWVVKTPLDLEDLEIEKPDYTSNALEEPKVLWFGKKQEYFSIAKEAKELDIFFTDKKSYNYKRLEEKIEDCTFVYLPPCFLEEQEIERQEKIKLCLRKGKYIIEERPLNIFLSDLKAKKITSRKLNKEVKEKQQQVLQEFDENLNSVYLEKALGYALEDSSLKI